MVAACVQGFLTANLQNHARKHKMPIDTVSCGYIMVDAHQSEIKGKPQDGKPLRNPSCLLPTAPGI
jgi:hypothetical protein